MSPVVNVAAASAPPRNSSNIASSKVRSQSARSYLHKQYLKVGLNRLHKHRPKGGLKSTLIHPSAWKELSANFAFTEVYEVQHSRVPQPGALGTGRGGILSEVQTTVCRKNIHDRAYLSIDVTSVIGAGLCGVSGDGDSGVWGRVYAGSWI